MRNSLYPVMPFVPFVAAMQSLLEINKWRLRPSRGAAAITGAMFHNGLAHNGFATVLLGLRADFALSVSRWAMRARIPLAVVPLAMLMACVTVISALKKML